VALILKSRPTPELYFRLQCLPPLVMVLQPSFGKDKWIHGCSIVDLAPLIAAAVPKKIR
jgi:hypothetical protein